MGRQEKPDRVVVTHDPPGKEANGDCPDPGRGWSEPGREQGRRPGRLKKNVDEIEGAMSGLRAALGRRCNKATPVQEVINP